MQPKDQLPGTNFQHQQPMGMPPMAQQPSALSRLIAVLPKLTFLPLLVAVAVLGSEIVLPKGHRLSDHIGNFYGSTESADFNAKLEAQARYERQLANARAAPPAQWQMEQQLSQIQQQNRLEALQGQSTAANIADIACMASGFMAAMMGNDDPVANAAKGACGIGDKLRRSMTRSLGEAEREGSGIEQRPVPEQPVELPPDQTPDDAMLEQLRQEQAERDRIVRGYKPLYPDPRLNETTHFVPPNQIAQP